MKNLIPHIEYLLRKKEYVILPGIGAFLLRHLPASVDSERGLLIPFRNSVSFNADVRTDDGALAHSLARRERLTLQEGRQIVEELMESLRYRLFTLHEKVSIPPIGVLYAGLSGTLQFTPTDGCPLLKSPGFEPCRLPDEVPVAEISSAASGGRRDRLNIGMPKTMAGIAAAVLLCIAVCLSFLLPGGTGATEQLASIIPPISSVTVSESMAAETVETSQPAVAGEEAVSEDLAGTAVELPVVDESEVAEEYPHYLIVGTFRSRSQAQEYIDYAMRRKSEPVEGVELALCEGNKGIWRVSAAGSDDKESLLRLMRDRQFRAVYPESWVWSR